MADNSVIVAGSVAKVVRTPGGSLENQVVSNQGPGTAFLGQAGVTTGSGLPFPPGSEIDLLHNGVAFSAITAGAPANLLVQAGSGAF